MKNILQFDEFNEELLSGKVEIPAEMQKKYIPVHEYRCVKNRIMRILN